MQTLANLEQIAQMVAGQHSNGVTLYVRTSTGPVNDRKMGCSTNHLTGRQENGMSVTTLVPDVEVWGAGNEKMVAMQIMSWASIAPVTYILTGDAVGFGSDGEIVVDPETWQPIAIVDTDSIQHAREIGCSHEHIDWYTDGGFCRNCNARIEKKEQAQ